MRMQFARATMAGAMFVVASVALAQNGSISGTVVDRETRRPIADARVLVTGTLHGTSTKANGTYLILGVPAGLHTVQVKAAGYETVQSQGIDTDGNSRRTVDFQIDRDNDGARTPPPPMTQVRPPRVEPGVMTPPPSTRTPPPMVEMGVVGSPASARTAPPPMMEPGVAMLHPPEQGPGMPSFENMLFPPELVMQHQRALELTSEQRRTITEAVKALQSQTVDLQWNLQAEQQALFALLEKRPINEQAAVAQMSKLVELEDAVKRTHLATLIKIKNALTEKQIGILNSLRRPQWEYPPPPARREWEFSSDMQNWTVPSPPMRDWQFSADLPNWTFPPPPARRQQQ
jgi:Spy/CpxP family protein refolding chaperone